MTIGIDCRLSGTRHAGIGRYIHNLILRLPTLAPDLEWVFWFAEQSQADEIPNAANVTKIVAPVKHYTLSEQWLMPRYFSRQKVDLLHIPHFNIPLFYRGKKVVTIHDLLWHEQRGTMVTTLPKWQYWLKYLAYRFVTTQAIRRAQRIFVPTKTISQTVTNYYPFASSKIVITKEGATAFPIGKSTSTRSKRHSLLYIGSLYPHKNLQVVLKALQIDKNLELVIVGSRSVFQEQMQKLASELGVSEQVTWAGKVSDQKLGKYLRAATALVQPSLSEGFGLTGIEAMAAGVPVLASAIPVFQEIYGRQALYFEPHDPHSLLKAITKVTHLDLQKYQKNTQEWVKRYSWDTMAQTTVDVYRSLLTKHV